MLMRQQIKTRDSLRFPLSQVIISSVFYHALFLTWLAGAQLHRANHKLLCAEHLIFQYKCTSPHYKNRWNEENYLLSPGKIPEDKINMANMQRAFVKSQRHI